MSLLDERKLQLPKYDRSRSYAWNFEHAPEADQLAEFELEVAEFPGDWQFCGIPVDSPLGIPAGPLLNGHWILYYGSLGFDVLTYKTVRRTERACYDLPNLQPVVCGSLGGAEQQLPVAADMSGSWAVSFGMPSKAPEVWRADVEWTRRRLAAGKLLNVSVVATVEDGWGTEELAADYAQCARWAVDSGADTVETNFSCPNVNTCDGQLYQQPATAAEVAAGVRAAIGQQVPYLVKIGHVRDEQAADELLMALGPYVDGIAMTNSIAATIVRPDGTLLFDGQRRGICGNATRTASVAQVALFRRRADILGIDVELIGVGGASQADHVAAYLNAGAQAVHIATAAMVDPTVALKIRQELAT